MYNSAKVKAKLATVAGWKPDPMVSPDLSASISGEFYNDVHPLLTYPNIYSAMPKTAHPAPADALSNYLKETTEAAALTAVNALLMKKAVEAGAKSIFEDKKLYYSGGSIYDKILKSNRFVGYRITVKNLADLALRIDKVGFQFTAAQVGTVTLHIYHTSNLSAPLKSIPLEITGNNNFVWNPTDLHLPNDSDEYESGGSFIIGYYESELTGQAITQNFSQICYTGCNPAQTTAYRLYSAYLKAEPIYYEATQLGAGLALPYDVLPTVRPNTTFGLNFSFSVVTDSTSFLLRNPGIFSNVIKLEVAKRILELLAYSGENNNQVGKLRPLALYALDNGPQKAPGIKSELLKAYAALDAGLSGIESPAYPVKRRLNRMGAV